MQCPDHMNSNLVFTIFGWPTFRSYNGKLSAHQRGFWLVVCCYSTLRGHDMLHFPGDRNPLEVAWVVSLPPSPSFSQGANTLQKGSASLHFPFLPPATLFSLENTMVQENREAHKREAGALSHFHPVSFRSVLKSTHMLKVRPWWKWPQTEPCLLIGNGLWGMKQTNCSFVWASVMGKKGLNWNV